ncbi:MAG: HlyD family efflux transporter periplasmic adaptor subunit [Cyanobacteria bacterium J06597_1]
MKNSGQRLKLAIAGAIALLIGVALWQLRQPNTGTSDDTSSPAPTVESLNRVAVAALGRLEPRGEVIRISGPTGERIGLLEVRRGTWVEPGEILAYLESHAERLAERDLAASQLAEAESRLIAQVELSQAEISEASTRLQQIERPATFEIQGQQATVRQLEVELAIEQADLARFQTLFVEGAISEQELDRQQSTASQLQERLSNARSALVRLETSRDTDMLNAEAQLRAAEANLELSRIQVAVDSARRNLTLAEARLERTIIRAPQAGRILQVYTRAGEAISASEGILDLGDTNQMFVVAEVYETDVTLVREGQPATIVSRNGAFSQALTGQVAEVGWQIFKNDVLDDDPAANADSRVVEVKIQLDNSERVAGLTNLQVDVRIDVSESSTLDNGDAATHAEPSSPVSRTLENWQAQPTVQHLFAPVVTSSTNL